jgi:anthranilate synthase component 1|uniref:Anthranilate synthase component 1 n=1 Tax=Desulfobacca acetoxidans TaxID=60893 RepID=A0A7C3V9J6_9BACT
MVIPDYATFRQMAEQGNVVPVYREILGDLETPVSAYKKLRNQGPSYLLESVEGGEKWGRYSFLGFNPSLILECRNRRVTLNRRGTLEPLDPEIDPFQHLRRVLQGYSAVNTPGLPRFWGGLVGYLGYDMVRFIERLPELTPPIPMPEARLVLADHVLIFDNLRQTIKVVVLCHLTPDVSLRRQYNQTVAEIHDIIERLRQPVPHGRSVPTAAGEGLSSNLTQEEFEAIVVKAKEYIAAGDIIQVVLSQCFATPLTQDPLDLYRALRCINPSPYMFFLDTGDLKLVGASPEVLVRLEGNHIIYRPIAGTRPRGATPEEDQALEADLLADPKERAEHIMLVDLGRNDVGRVSAIGTVRVPELFTVERYSHVMHLVSQVEGELAAGQDGISLLASTFPAGTVTGAPKVRAMEIIEELEPTRRGPYAGAVGYLGFSGNLDFCITIRSFTIYHNRVFLQVGAGIVADSDPTREYQETVNKAKALMRALELAEEGLW